MERLRTELGRDEQLYRQHTITPEEYDQARAAYQVAVEKPMQARKRYDLVKEGPRQEQIDQARAALAQAEAQYRAGQGRAAQGRPSTRPVPGSSRPRPRCGWPRCSWSYATVASPLTGVVLSKNIEPGEYVAPGTAVVTVGDIDNVWLRAYIDETDVGTGRVKWGQEAEITTDAYPGRVYKGWVSFIASEEEFTPKTCRREKERVKLVYRIKINMDNPDTGVEARHARRRRHPADGAGGEELKDQG